MDDEYESLRARLADGFDAGDVVTLPDGSVDRYYAVEGARGDRVATREEFVDRLAAGARALTLRLTGQHPGGQAVNAARQVDALGTAVTCYGHLDDPRLQSLPFDCVSMGAPATVHVLSFEESELMFSVESDAITDWSIERLFSTLAVSPDEWLTDQTVVLQNWAGLPGMTDALWTLSETDTGDATFVFDPGTISEASPESLKPLCAALAALAATTDVVLTANDGELERIADALDIDADQRRRLCRLRDVLGLDAVVLHHETHATAVAEELHVVANVETNRVARRTGAGDRFDGGLAVGLAADLPWPQRLALGNACAAYHVETGETATCADLVAFLDGRHGRLGSE